MDSPTLRLPAVGRPFLDGTHRVQVFTDFPVAFETIGVPSQRPVFARLHVGKKSCGCIVAGITYSPRNAVEIDSFKLKHLGIQDGAEVGIERCEPVPAKKVSLLLAPDFPPSDLARLRQKPLVAGEKTPLFAISGEARVIQVLQTQPEGIVLITGGTEIERSAGQASEYPISYKDIGGLDREIRQVREVVELPLRFPEIFDVLGVSHPRGLILYGPPGTGKTLIAKALAAEVGARIFVISGPEIYSKWYGESEERLRKTFEEARAASPAIILIDELDALVPRRDAVHGELEQRVVASFLTLMDGINAMKGVVVVGTTNRIDSIDPALRREGRFGAEISIGVPDVAGRQQILRLHARHMPLSGDVDLDRIASRCTGYVGADLASLCREAAYAALRRRVPLDGMSRLQAGDFSDLRVEGKDFEAAQALVRPSAMREFMVEIPDVPWESIGGLDEVKRLLVENVAHAISRREAFRKAGVSPARGLLLFGPPGTGKTLLAKATACQCGANFISVKGPELRSRWFGESEGRIRHIFRKAREAAPCVIFFDEIDAVAPSRGTDIHTDSLVNQILCEMDGVESAEGVFILAATNRADLIDAALLRPGRFDYQIEVPLPDAAARLAIFSVHLRGKPLASGVRPEDLVEETEGLSGAEIAEVCREAAMAALREVDFDGDRVLITSTHLRASLGGVRRTAESLGKGPLGFSMPGSGKERR
jgi:transitional endoplasmic reticulum ATPase